MVDLLFLHILFFLHILLTFSVTLSFCSVILNKVKNLLTRSLCIQILRHAQNDKMISCFSFDTPSYSKWERNV